MQGLGLFVVILGLGAPFGDQLWSEGDFLVFAAALVDDVPKDAFHGEVADAVAIAEDIAIQFIAEDRST